MLFNSGQFLVFFPVVTLLYFGVPPRYRWLLLLGASSYFYMAFVPIYILILAFTIIIDYTAAILIERAEGARKRIYLYLSLVANLGILAVFKYFNFFNDNLSALASFFDLHYPLHHLAILLPIGLSFHTFQSLSYTVEVYRGNQRTERHLGIFALYVMFYPQLVAGPIERPQNLLRQFREEHRFDLQRTKSGLKRMVWGFFKKVVIADGLAVCVDQVYTDPLSFYGISLILATVCFTFQIYCDFSGYSDIAIGAAQIMGFKLMENFRQPYLARSIADFWRRWHISLSTWFKDYLYIPLGGNRAGVARHFFNLMVTFLLSGFWHGASWTFIVWGGLHGFYMVLFSGLERLKERTAVLARLDTSTVFFRGLQMVVVFVLVSFAWIFFRAASLQDAVYIAANLHKGLWHFFVNFKLTAAEGILASMGLNRAKLVMLSAAVAVLMLVEGVCENEKLRQKAARLPAFVSSLLFYSLVLAILSLGEFRSAPFIYFQF